MKKPIIIRFLLLAILISTAIVLFACYNPQGGGMLFTEVEGGYQKRVYPARAGFIRIL